MKLIQIMRRGPDKELSTESWNSATMAPIPLGREKGPEFSNECQTVKIWFQTREPDYFESSRYRVEIDRGEAMELRDYLNRMFPETEKLDSAEKAKESN